MEESEGKHPQNEEGETIPHEIEMVEVKAAHIGRLVIVHEPGKPDWKGELDGWDPSGVFVKPPNGPREIHAPGNLTWEV